MRWQQMDFFTAGSAASYVLMTDLFLKIFSFSLHKTLIDEWSWGLLFLSSVQTHSDGTHSLQRIYWWALSKWCNAEYLQICSDEETDSWMSASPISANLHFCMNYSLNIESEKEYDKYLLLGIACHPRPLDFVSDCWNANSLMLTVSICYLYTLIYRLFQRQQHKRYCACACLWP